MEDPDADATREYGESLVADFEALMADSDRLQNYVARELRPQAAQLAAEGPAPGWLPEPEPALLFYETPDFLHYEAGDLAERPVACPPALVSSSPPLVCDWGWRVDRPAGRRGIRCPLQVHRAASSRS